MFQDIGGSSVQMNTIAPEEDPGAQVDGRSPSSCSSPTGDAPAADHPGGSCIDRATGVMSRGGALAAIVVLAASCSGASDDAAETAVTTSVATADAPVPAETSPDGAVQARDVTIETDVGDTAATFVVASPEPGPVVLLIAGSGPTDRDGNSALLPGSIDTLRFLADGLAAEGVSSIRFDKIAVGASEVPADVSALTFDDFVVQAAGVRAWLAEQAEIDPEAIVLAGHSEGALIASELAAEDAPAGLALITPVGERYLDLIRRQVESALDADRLAEFDRLVSELRSSGELTEPPADPLLSSLFAPASQAFLASADLSDPVRLAAAIDADVDTVIACGTVDVQISCSSLDELRNARPATSLTDITLEGVNHVLRRSGGEGDASTYTDESFPHADEVVDALVQLARTP